MTRGYRLRYRSTDGNKPDAYCENCGEAFYDTEKLYRYDGLLLCEECVRAEIARLPMDELADIMGFDVVLAANERSDDDWKIWG